MLLALAGCTRRRAGPPAAACVARLTSDADAFATGALPPLRPPSAAAGWQQCDGHAALVTAFERLAPAARAHAATTRPILDQTGAPIDPPTRAWLLSERFDEVERAALCDRFELPPAPADSLAPRAALHAAPVAGVSTAIAARAMLPETPPAERRRLAVVLALLATDLQRTDAPGVVGLSERLLAYAQLALRSALEQPPGFTDAERARLRAAVDAQAVPWRVIAVEYVGVARALALARTPAYARERFRGRTVDDGVVGEACATTRARFDAVTQGARARPTAYRDVTGQLAPLGTANPVSRALEPAWGVLATTTERLAATQARFRELVAQVR